MPATPKPDQKLPRRLILRNRAEIDALFRAGRRVANRYFTLLMRPAAEGSIPQAGFFTPKKLGNAVVRNQLRRRMKEIYRRELKSITPAGQWIFLARSAAVELNYATLREKMKELHAKVDGTTDRQRND